ncbi:MAG: OOP family OmpA-OmpF porin [bacterium]|jgi:OOP family OmpA-OmpF porin
MGSKRLVPVILIVGLLLGGSYYYLCKIKQVCDGVTVNLKTDITDTSDTSGHQYGPLSFRFNSAEPVVGKEFESLREQLYARLGDTDTLVINGMYYSNEQNGVALAQERAENVQSLLQDHFDVDRLRIQTNFDGISSVDDQTSIEGVTFMVVSGEDEIAENEDESDILEEELPAATESYTDENSIQPIRGKTIIYFPKGSIKKNITQETRSYFNTLVANMQNDPSIKVYVVGHSDGEGDEEENYQLGRRRAWVIKKMIWDMGVVPIRIVTSSKGEMVPMNDNDSEVNRAYNRRVEVMTNRE